MPKLPVLSGKDVVKALERLRFELGRQRGSHVIMQRKSVGCVASLHKQIKSGTLAGIIRQAQLTQNEFLRAVR